MMKICCITTSFPAYKDDVQSPFIYVLAKNLVKQGVDLTVVCPYYKKSKDKNEILDGIKVKRFAYFPRSIQTLTEKGGISDFKKNIWSLVQLPFFMCGMFLKAYKEAKNSQVIHCQWALSGVVGVFVKLVRKKPLIISLRGEDVKALNNRWMRMILKKVIKRADYVTANNEFHINKVLPFAKNVRVIRNGIDTVAFRPRPKKELRKKLQLENNKKIVLFVGWLVERKGIQYLIEAIPAVVKEYTGVVFLLIGDGPLRESLEKKAAEKKISQYVQFLGKKTQSEVAEYMAAADIFALPSLYEGMPNVVMEAFASGLTAVATDVCGTSEVVEHKKNGLLIRSENPKELAEGIALLLKNEDLRKKYSREALATIKKLRLTWERCAVLHKNLYGEVLRKEKN